MRTKFANELPSVDFLRSILSYDPITGSLRWKERPRSMFNSDKACKMFNTRRSNKEAGVRSVRNGVRGGIVIGIDKRHIQASRVIHAIHTGTHVPLEIEVDHIDRDPWNNKWNNLRLATSTQNLHNRGTNRNNASGFKGVCYDKARKSWEAYIWKDWKKIHLGRHASPEEAHQAFKEAALRLRGEFASA